MLFFSLFFKEKIWENFKFRKWLRFYIGIFASTISIVFWILELIIIPNVKGLFSDFSLSIKDLPIITRLLISSSSFFTTNIVRIFLIPLNILVISIMVLLIPKLIKIKQLSNKQKKLFYQLSVAFALIVMGIFVAFMSIGVYLPIYGLGNLITQ